MEKPVRKRTRAEREAERPEMVAKAAEEQASGRARPFAIRDPPARAGLEVEVWAESDVPGPPEPRPRKQQRQITQIQLQS